MLYNMNNLSDRRECGCSWPKIHMKLKKKNENSSITFQLEKDNIVYLMETNLTISNLI